MGSRVRLHALVLALVVLGLGATWLDRAQAGRGGVGEPARLDRRRQPLPQRNVHDPEIVAVVHGGRRPDRAQHRRPEDRPQHGQPASLLQLDARSQPLRPAVVRGRRSGWLGRRPASLRRRPLPAGLEPELRFRAAICREAPATDEPAGRADRLAREPRLDPDRVPGHGRPGGDDLVPGHERPGDRSAVRAPEQERLRHGTEHEADDGAAQALLHAVEVRPQGDGLGRPLCLDPAGPKGCPGGARSSGGAVGCRECVTVDRSEPSERSIVESKSCRDRERSAGPGRGGRRESRPGRGCRSRLPERCLRQARDSSLSGCCSPASWRSA